MYQCVSVARQLDEVRLLGEKRLQTPFNFWSPERQTCEIYLRTNRQDWFAAIDKIVEEIDTAKTLIDVGSGDGHSTRQILARSLHHLEYDLLEPDSAALARSQLNERTRFPTTLEQFLIKHPPQTKVTSWQRIKVKDWWFGDDVYDLVPLETQTIPTYDAAIAIHSNYYWGIRNGKHSQQQYKSCIDGLVSLAKKTIIMTVPHDSEYHTVVQKNPFSDDVFAENIVAYATKQGYSTRVVPCGMRFYVGDCFKDSHAATELWRFFHNTQGDPKKDELTGFLSKLQETQRDGTIDFKDLLIVIEKQS
jgi:hypothetical protein